MNIFGGQKSRQTHFGENLKFKHYLRACASKGILRPMLV